MSFANARIFLECHQNMAPRDHERSVDRSETVIVERPLRTLPFSTASRFTRALSSALLTLRDSHAFPRKLESHLPWFVPFLWTTLSSCFGSAETGKSNRHCRPGTMKKEESSVWRCVRSFSVRTSNGHFQKDAH